VKEASPALIKIQGSTAGGSIGRLTGRTCMTIALITGITGQDGSYLTELRLMTI
jgi:hypothetical protein